MQFIEYIKFLFNCSTLHWEINWTPLQIGALLHRWISFDWCVYIVPIILYLDYINHEHYVKLKRDTIKLIRKLVEKPRSDIWKNYNFRAIIFYLNWCVINVKTPLTIPVYCYNTYDNGLQLFYHYLSSH
jgi:hypothetical protein